MIFSKAYQNHQSSDRLTVFGVNKKKKKKKAVKLIIHDI